MHWHACGYEMLQVVTALVYFLLRSVCIVTFTFRSSYSVICLRCCITCGYNCHVRCAMRMMRWYWARARAQSSDRRWKTSPYSPELPPEYSFKAFRKMTLLSWYLTIQFYILKNSENRVTYIQLFLLIRHKNVFWLLFISLSGGYCAPICYCWRRWHRSNSRQFRRSFYSSPSSMMYVCV